MKKKIFQVLIGMMVLAMGVNAQSPQKMSYQMVVRNNSNALVNNQVVGVKISVLQGSATGTAVFSETHAPTTNANGLASFVIGEGTVLSGSFSQIDWANGPYFLKNETDPAGGTNYSITGTSQLLSVPYALYAGASPSQGKTFLILNGALTNAEATARIAAEAGPNTQFVLIQNTTALTSVNLAGLAGLEELVIENNKQLTMVSAPALKSINSKLSLKNNEVLTSVSLPALLYVFDLTVEGNKQYTTFSLPALDRIASKLSIKENPVMNTVTFSALTEVRDTVVVRSNAALSSFSAPSLSKLFASCEISSNPVLTNIDLPSLTTSTSNLISFSASLASLTLPQLTTGIIILNSNNQLTSLNAPALTTGGISLSFNNQLTSLNTPALTTGGISLSFNGQLTSLNLPALTTAGGISLSSNNQLTSLNMPALTTAGRITLSSNAISNVSFPALTTLTGSSPTTEVFRIADTNTTTLSLPSLTSVTGTFNILSQKIPTLHLPSLVTVNGTISIQTCPRITTITMPLVANGSFNIVDNPQLNNISVPSLATLGTTTISGNSITTLSLPASLVNGNISIHNNPSLNTLGFPALTTSNNSMSIYSNSSLANINFSQFATGPEIIIYGNNISASIAFPQLRAVAGYFRLSTFSNISLPLLDSTAGDFIVSGNNIVSISLPRLSAVKGNFTITSNPLLTSISIPLFFRLGSSNGAPSIINFNSNQLPVSVVNSLLNRLVSITPPLVNKTISLSLQSPPAPPSGQGITDKATLISRPNIVTTD